MEGRKVTDAQLIADAITAWRKKDPNGRAPSDEYSHVVWYSDARAGVVLADEKGEIVEVSLKIGADGLATLSLPRILKDTLVDV